MADCTISPPADLIRALEQMENMDQAAPRILDAGMVPLEKKVRQNLRRHSRTGDLLSSLKSGKSHKNAKGVWEKRLTFSGKDRKGAPNVVKAAALEYGTVKQEPEPFLRPAVIESEAECIAEMEDLFAFESGLRGLSR